MGKFPVDAPKSRVVRALARLGFEPVREGEHIAMRRRNLDGSVTPLTLPNHSTPDPDNAGLPRDESRAFSLYLEGCKRDYMAACWQAGVQYAEGEGVARDLERARALLQKACDGGEADACSWIEKFALR